MLLTLTEVATTLRSCNTVRALPEVEEVSAFSISISRTYAATHWIERGRARLSKGARMLTRFMPNDALVLSRRKRPSA